MRRVFPRYYWLAGRATIRSNSISQALNFEIHRSFWDDKSIEGLNRLAGALGMDQYIGLVTRRPW